MLFQSTPPAEARGDRMHREPRCSGATGFNPLPPPKRGETRCNDKNHGRYKFQSTPPAEARGDALAQPRRLIFLSFNPLPPPKRGETSSVSESSTPLREFQSTPPAEARGDDTAPAVERRASEVSIHSPRRSEGRPRFHPHRRAVATVSIHSPRRSEGRLARSTAHANIRRSFNPLPPPKRGETGASLAAVPD